MMLRNRVNEWGGGSQIVSENEGMKRSSHVKMKIKAIGTNCVHAQCLVYCVASDADSAANASRDAMAASGLASDFLQKR